MKFETKYEWNGPYNANGVRAEVAAKELERIRKANKGDLLPEQIVEQARKQTNPLHPAFEWDNKLAADKYRIGQAQQMLRALVIRVPQLDDAPVRKYHAVRRDPSAIRPQIEVRKYITLDDMLRDPEKRAEVLQDVMNQFMSLRRKYRDLNELAIVWRAIDEAMASVVVE